MDDIISRIEQQFERIDRRFDRVDQRFDLVEQRFEQVDQKFERLYSEMAHTNRVIAQIGWGLVGALFVQLLAAIIALS